MSTEPLETFRSSLGGTTTAHACTADDFEQSLSDAIAEPAVGTPLPFDGVSLAETPVETDPSPGALEDAQTGVTPARHAIADYGTVTIPSDSAGSELVSLYVHRHVAVLAASAIAPDMRSAYERFAEDVAAGVDSQVLATGPSATADMGTLVHGVHGPHEVHVVILEDR